MIFNPLIKQGGDHPGTLRERGRRALSAERSEAALREPKVSGLRTSEASAPSAERSEAAYWLMIRATRNT